MSTISSFLSWPAILVASLMAAVGALAMTVAVTAQAGEASIYFLKGAGYEQELWRADLRGKQPMCVASAGDQRNDGDGTRNYDVSRDGRFLVQAVDSPRERDGLVLHDLLRGTTRRLTNRQDLSPRFSPDGRRIAFVREPRSNHFGIGGLYLVRVPGGAVRRIGRDSGVSRPTWRPDGRAIAYLRGRFARRVDVASGRSRWMVGRPHQVGTVPYAPVVHDLHWTTRGLLYTSEFIPDPSAGGTRSGEPDIGIYATRRPVKVKGRLVRSFGRRPGVLPVDLSSPPSGRMIVGQLRQHIYSFRAHGHPTRLTLPKGSSTPLFGHVTASEASCVPQPKSGAG